MKAEDPVPADGATLAHLCPQCDSRNTVKMTLKGSQHGGHETWKCRDCGYTWDLHAGLGEARPEQRIFRRSV